MQRPLIRNEKKWKKRSNKRIFSSIQSESQADDDGYTSSLHETILKSNANNNKLKARRFEMKITDSKWFEIHMAFQFQLAVDYDAFHRINLLMLLLLLFVVYYSGWRFSSTMLIVWSNLRLPVRLSQEHLT